MSTSAPELLSRTATVNRRVILRGVGALAVGTATLASLSACADPSNEDTPEADPLTAESERARRDAASATAAMALFPGSTDTLTVVSDQRRAHADALDVEIARLTPPPTTTSASDTAPGPAPDPVEPPTLAELSTALSESSRRAADVARSLSGYRAGLLGSISAACSLASSAVSA